MMINGLGRFDMMSAYNRIDINERIPSVQAPVEKAQEVKPAEEPKQEAQEIKVNLTLDGMKSRPSLNIEDLSRDFAKRDSYSIKAYDDQSMKAEMDKAVSAMQKDESIAQYQYFVGQSNVILDNEDGTVIAK